MERLFAEVTRDLPNAPTTVACKRWRKIRDWITAWNDNPKPFIWTKTAEEIRLPRTTIAAN